MYFNILKMMEKKNVSSYQILENIIKQIAL